MAGSMTLGLQFQRVPRSALDMKCPAEVYQSSPRVYQGLPDINYPFHDKVIMVAISFMDYDLGYFDLDTRVLEPLDNSLSPRLSPM